MNWKYCPPPRKKSVHNHILWHALFCFLAIACNCIWQVLVSLMVIASKGCWVGNVFVYVSVTLFHFAVTFSWLLQIIPVISCTVAVELLGAFSALTLLVGRQEGHVGVVGCWRGYQSGARCRLAYGPADATATRCLLLQWNANWFYLTGTGSPG